MIGSCNRSTMSYDYFPLQVPLPTPSVTNAFEPERSDTQQRVHRQPCSNSIPNHRDFVVPPKGSLELRVIEVGRCNPRPVSTQISCRDVLLTVNVCPRTSCNRFFLFLFFVLVPTHDPRCHRNVIITVMPPSSPSYRRHHTVIVSVIVAVTVTIMPPPSYRHRYTVPSSSLQTNNSRPSRPRTVQEARLDDDR